MNGVIVDNESFHESIIRQLLSEKNIAVSHEDFKRIFYGRTDENGFKSLVHEYKLSDNPLELIKEKRRREQGKINDSFTEVQGSRDLIKRLSTNFTLAIVSSAIRSEVNSVLKKFGLDKYFKIIVSGDDVVYGKPNPEPYLLASTKLNIAPEKCIVIEDAENGIISAITAGMKAIALRSSYSLSTDFKQANAIVDNLMQTTPKYIHAL